VRRAENKVGAVLALAHIRCRNLDNQVSGKVNGGKIALARYPCYRAIAIVNFAGQGAEDVSMGRTQSLLARLVPGKSGALLSESWISLTR
jgi:hypothetical protein